MQPVQSLFYVYGSSLDSEPLDEGTPYFRQFGSLNSVSELKRTPFSSLGDKGSRVQIPPARRGVELMAVDVSAAAS